jgi:hypothetical protein
MPRQAWYFYRLKDDNLISEFCVANGADPNQYVETPAPDGSLQRWDKREEGELIVFHPPDGYFGGPVGWMYDKTIQIGQAMPREELERQALRCRTSMMRR